jgi:hypothetical protein
VEGADLVAARGALERVTAIESLIRGEHNIVLPMHMGGVSDRLGVVSAGAQGRATVSIGGPLKSETSRPATVVAIALPS